MFLKLIFLELDMYAAYEFQQLGRQGPPSVLRNDPILDRPMSAQARLTSHLPTGRYGFESFETARDSLLNRPAVNNGFNNRVPEPKKRVGNHSVHPSLMNGFNAHGSPNQQKLDPTSLVNTVPNPVNNPGEPIRSALLEEFRNNKNKKYELKVHINLYNSFLGYSW